ncbi:hypothetical protein, variant [Phialophora macrospora]|uniref:Uncharacterized protein n=1 Tax=Phialophora macrospora TaxID=1851006 RepID=A0A0D2FG19_9EURO|nr:hypothetical protein PV04_07988 [Phialophora macrospora]KIW65761.1 hypothetical protein, variant [Phialophora macrospora]
MDLGHGDGWLTDPDIKLFDSNKFQSEVQQLEQDEGTSVTEDQYASLVAFLTGVANAQVDFGQKTSLQGDQSMLQSAVQNVSAPAADEFDPDQVYDCVAQLVQEGHCNNIFAYLAVMHKDQIDFTSASPEIQTALDSISQEIADVKGDQPILAL